MLSRKRMEEVKGKLKTIYRQSNQHSGGLVRVLRQAFQRFNQSQAGEAAASLAYYTMFSLFPLLLALIAAGSFFLEGKKVRQEVIESVSHVIPISQELIESNIQQVLDSRGTVGALVILIFLWSGSGAFSVLVRHINCAWIDAKPRNLLERRLVALGIVGVLAALLFFTLLASPLLNLLPRLQVDFLFFETVKWTLLTVILPGFLTLLIFLGLYRWIPNTKVMWREALGGALFVTVAWEGAKHAFTWYLSSGLVRYRLVYGSLGAVIALMLWIYISSWLTIFGAHLSAAIMLWRNEETPPAGPRC